MAKYKAPKGKKTTAVKQDLRGALPCMVLISLLFGLILLLFYWGVKSSS